MNRFIRYIVVIDIADNDYYFDHIKDLKEEIESLLHVGGKVVSLKPMPKKKGYSEFKEGYCDGYNECLDEILGE